MCLLSDNLTIAIAATRSHSSLNHATVKQIKNKLNVTSCLVCTLWHIYLYQNISVIIMTSLCSHWFFLRQGVIPSQPKVFPQAIFSRKIVHHRAIRQSDILSVFKLVVVHIFISVGCHFHLHTSYLTVSERAERAVRNISDGVLFQSLKLNATILPFSLSYHTRKIFPKNFL